MGFRRRLAAGLARVPRGRFFGPRELRLALLALLGEKPSHGYELMTRLEARCGGAYQASAGAVYPTLQQLEDEGFVRVELDEGRKGHHLSAAGRRELADHTPDVERIWARADQWSEWGMFTDPGAAEIVGPALRLAKAALKAVVHDPDATDEVRAIFEAARDQIERLVRRRKK
jgi:DNA-binding PadR family transcriptional regulator